MTIFLLWSSAVLTCEKLDAKCSLTNISLCHTNSTFLTCCSQVRSSAYCELCGRGKDFHNEAWRLDRLHSSPVTWIARNRYVGMEVACLRNVHFHIGTIGPTVAPAQKIPKDALDI